MIAVITPAIDRRAQWIARQLAFKKPDYVRVIPMWLEQDDTYVSKLLDKSEQVVVIITHREAVNDYLLQKYLQIVKNNKSTVTYIKYREVEIPKSFPNGEIINIQEDIDEVITVIKRFVDKTSKSEKRKIIALASLIAAIEGIGQGDEVEEWLDKL